TDLKSAERLVERLGRLLGADPRTILICDAVLNDCNSVRKILWSHVVDWFATGLSEVAALKRLDWAWTRCSFRSRLLGLGLVAGAPSHVVSHHQTRLQMADDL